MSSPQVRTIGLAIAILFLAGCPATADDPPTPLNTNKFAPQPAITEPELCVGTYQSEEAGEAQLDRFRQTFSHAADWCERADVIRSQILLQTGLDPLPCRTPLNPIVRKKRKYPCYSVESIAYEALPGFFVFGSLYRPSPQISAPYAGVLSTHGHWSDPDVGGRYRPDNQIRCATLARMGAVVLAVDMIGFGESGKHGWQHESEQTLPLQLWTNIRALDYLTSIPEVDPRRLAVTGASGGGTQSFLLGAVDRRLAVSVPVCMVSAHFFGGCVCESGHPIHRTPLLETNNADIAATFAPKPQLLLSVGTDWSKNTPTVEYPYLRDVYRLFGREDAVENKHFPDEDHDYGPSKRHALYSFLSRHLSLDVSCVDESAVVIESRETMEVFDGDRPLPAHAIGANSPVSWR